MKKLTLFLAVLLISNSIFSQNVSGIVVTGNQQPVAGATIKFISQVDSTITGTTTTQVDGRFSINLRAGSWKITVDAMGFRLYKADVGVETGSNLQLPQIIVQPAEVKELEEVITKAKKTLLEHSIDRTTVNVDAMISSSSSNALEVLARTPGVNVDNNGNISMNGKSGVMVLIDGRQTYMSSQDLSNYLKSIPGATLEKIELIDNPPARYDAAGNSIINLQLKKKRVAGWTGSVSTGYSQGRYGRQNYAGNLNFNYKKVTWYTNIGHNRDRIFSDDVFNRRYFDQQGQLASLVLLNNAQRFRGRLVNLVSGIDYQLSTKTNIGVMVNLNGGKRVGDFDYNSTTRSPMHMITAEGYGSTYSTDKRNNLTVNMNMLHKLKQKGQEISVEANHMRYRIRMDQDLLNFQGPEFGGNVAVSKFAYIVPADISIYTAKSDYVQPFLKGTFEAGIKTSFVTNDNVSDFYDKKPGTPEWIEAMSNHFIYKENINAGYFNFNQRFKRFSLQAGFRAEQTIINGHQVGNSVVKDSSFRRDYWKFFPSAAIGYKLDSSGTRQLIFLYSRRINRPSYQSLNPFVFYRDNFSYSGGNPMLNPQIQTRYELKYQHGQRWWTGLSYNNFTSVILPITTVQDSLYITRPDNYARGYMVLLNVGVSISPAKWWTINSTIRLSRIGLRGNFDNTKLRPNTNILRWEFNSYFPINDKFSAELNSYYASADLNGQNKTSGMYRVNTGFQYKLSEKGSIRLNLDDIFYSWKYHNRSVGLTQADYTQVSTSDTQRFGISFNYRFGKKASKTRRGTDEEEAGRVQ
ncbi:TonB-dependent receptor [Terrimonas sp. NA20]|uniref:TonB-dependent receptor n=1 Tax=Terrimonas ginsenosidimutans TaxID=2908004 RepID=A0ABS9KVL0_9BACT|nr:outer membrane beta-barrel protein [Terrimonas ginsenosidimutans]MCG2616394.1 TonB-dependent receptor [Terrimonas ginsenosidimutans]